MGGSPALPFLVPLEHREVSHPQEPEVSAHERTMLRSIFLSQSHAQQASSRVYRMVVLLDFGLHAAFRRMSTRLADRKSTRLNSSHRCISYAVFCLKKKTMLSFRTRVVLEMQT